MKMLLRNTDILRKNLRKNRRLFFKELGAQILAQKMEI